MDLLVDPLVFAVPPAQVTGQELDEYVSYLVQWRDDFIAGEHNFMIGRSCAFALDDNDCYPYIEKLQEIWQQNKIIDTDYMDVYNACIKVLSNLPFFEERIPELDEIDLFEDTVHVRPDLLERQPEKVAQAFQETLGYVAYARSVIPESIAGNLLLLTYPIEGESLAEIWAKVLTESPEDTDYTELSIYSEVTLVVAPDDLLDLMEFSDIWEDTYRAIQWKARNMQRQHALSPFKVHTTFNESIKKNDLQQQAGLLDRIFRQCVLLLNMEWTAIETHELGKPQHTVHNWKSFRLYITEGSPGWRLHYWRRGNEFYLMHVFEHDIDYIDVPNELHNKDFRF